MKPNQTHVTHKTTFEKSEKEEIKLKCETLLSFHQVHKYLRNLWQIMPEILQNSSWVVLFCYYFIPPQRACKEVNLPEYKEESEKQQQP